jgi:H+-transporting ATPase
VLGTQTLATLIAVYGLFMTPLGWGWAAFVWGYALIWALVNDRVKLLAYAILDKHQNKNTTDLTASKAKASAELTPQIAKRAYEIYETRGHNDGQADQDWVEAEHELQKK